SKMMMTEFLIDRFPNGKVNDQAIGELEVLYEESKKRFVEEAEFRERTQPVQEWDKRHKIAWENICSISRERYRKVYQRLRVRMKEEGERLHDFYISKALDSLREKGFNTNSKGDEAIVIEGRELPLVDFAALWHALEIEKADRIVHVADVEQRDKIGTCITAAESLGWTVTNHCHDPLSHVGFGLLQVEDVKGLGLLQLLDEAKSRCKAILGVKDKEGEYKEGEHTAEALGYGAVKYEVLKNNRLTNHTFSFNDMLKKTGKSLTLKDDRERELGLHVLRFTELPGETNLPQTIVAIDEKYKARKNIATDQFDRYGVSVPALTKDHKGIEDQYAVSKKDQYAVLDIWHVNILEDIKRGSYSKKQPNHDKLRVVVFPISLLEVHGDGLIKPNNQSLVGWREDGYCNGGNLPGAYHIGNSLHYQDLEWYETLEDSELKDEALRNKAIMEGLISDDESSNDCWKRWKSHEIYYHDYDEGEYENETHEEGHELCSIKTREACRAIPGILSDDGQGWMIRASSVKSEEKSNLKTSAENKSCFPGDKPGLYLILSSLFFPDIKTAYPLHTYGGLE
ncbi:arginine--tRNA ligase, chloroplastic/mitochondrial-like protein isoform X2, partial [Tanacetum coccineum]